ncbi:MAG: lysylphosphatidylglycerol synthase domain-containing protein [Pseudomonadota bacterium]|nr:lysylphosphatidylglycerol synthase domain-containing protein [Pseudomonadota bacterium]
MADDEMALLALAVLLLLVAHGARAARWAFLFPKNYLTGRLSLLIGLGVGYAVNALIPLRVGEIVRGAAVTRLANVRFSYAMATIVAERVADLAVLALLMAATTQLASGGAYALATAAVFALAALASFAAAFTIRRSGTARRLVWQAAGIFNDRIRLGVVDFVWSSAEMLTRGSLLRWRFVTATIVMWALYAAAYAAFGRAIGAPVLDVVAAILQQPLQSLADSMRGAGRIPDQTSLFVFVLTPILLILIYGGLMQSNVFARAADLILLRHGRSGRGSPRAQRDRFSAASSYESFLGALFSGEDNAVSGFGMEAVEDCIVHKFFHGGSDAITALVETNQRLIIRKFAVGSAAAKLRVQADWLQRNTDATLPLVEVIGERGNAGVYSYDMPLVTPANDFYDVIHSSPTARNRARLTQVLVCMDALHARTAAGEADPGLVSQYLEEKVSRNAAVILNFARHAMGRDAYSINDGAYDLAEWRSLADPDWLQAQIRDRRVATIHGDLTIENVIIAPDEPSGLYIIDPNPENLFDSPLIDWAKMMQSLHLGYETLNRGITCNLSGGAIQIAAARSQAYAELHETLEAEIRSRFGEDGLREIYFHELVNYLRLTTYKIRQSQTRGFGFFACCSLLLRRYRERYG